MTPICSKGCKVGLIDNDTIQLEKYSDAGSCILRIIYVDKNDKQHIFNLVSSECCTKLGTCALKIGARCCVYKIE
jgi:hypothetical protein